MRRTTFDQTLKFGGNTFTPAPLEPSTFDEQIDLSPNQMELLIDLGATGISEAALTAGTWDRARLLIQVVDYTNLAAPYVRKWQGFLARGKVVNGQLARAEFLSISNLLAQRIGHLYSPTCRVRRYGDAECGKDVTAETFTGEVISPVTDGANFRVDVTQAVANYFQFGVLEFTSGANQGLELEIKTSTPTGSDTNVVMVAEFPLTVAIGDEVTLIRGCDREYPTCVARNNGERFRGEPNIPGIYKLTRRFPD